MTRSWSRVFPFSSGFPFQTVRCLSFHCMFYMGSSLTKADMIPEDSRVEIDAKINAGYFTTGKKYTTEELAQIEGRGWQSWEDVPH